MERIRVPFVVTQDERKRIKESFLAGIESANKDKVQYIVANLPRVLRRLRASDESWQVEIAVAAEQLASLLQRDSNVPAGCRRDLVAALYYLCQPFEVIPDHVPGRGYADDALVINACISRLRQKGVNFGRREDNCPLFRSKKTTSDDSADQV